MANAKRIKCANIGCGSIGNTHADQYANCSQAEFAAVCDVLPHKAEAVAAKYKVPDVYADYKKMLKDDSIKAVSICLPNYLHAPVTIDALRAGKHVLCEKPIALNMKQAKTMQAEAKKAKKMLAIGVVNRFHDNVNYIRSMIQNGELGEVFHCHLSFLSHRSIPGMGGWVTTKAKSGGGVMIDWGVHFIDLALYCLGFPKLKNITGVAYGKLMSKPKEYAYTSMWGTPLDLNGSFDTEDFVSAMLRTAGPSISMDGAWARNIGESQMYIDFVGDKAGIRLQYGSNFTVYGQKNGVLYKTEPTLRVGSMFQNEINDFVACAADGKTSSRASIDSVLITQQVLDSFYLSAAKGCEIKL